MADAVDPFLVLALVFAVPGVALAIGELRNIARGLASRTWPTTNGRVVYCGVNIGTVREQTDSAPHVEYEYDVLGATYQSRRLDYGGAYSGAPDQVAPALLQYKVGTPVTVHYNPEDPREAVLITGVTRYTYSRLRIGLYFVLLAVFIAAYFLSTA